MEQHFRARSVEKVGVVDQQRHARRTGEHLEELAERTDDAIAGHRALERRSRRGRGRQLGEHRARLGGNRFEARAVESGQLIDRHDQGSAGVRPEAALEPQRLPPLFLGERAQLADERRLADPRRAAHHDDPDVLARGPAKRGRGLR